MSKGKEDFISECLNSMEQKGSLEDFEIAFCSVCINPDCHRSKWSDSKWMTRMLMQEEALSHPTFMSQDDPRFIALNQEMRFEEIDPTLHNYYGGWVEIQDDGKVVNKVPAPTESTESDKVTHALKQLRKAKDLPPKEEEVIPDTPAPEAPEPSPEPSKEVPPVQVKEEVPEPVEEKREPIRKPLRPSPLKNRNTQAPSQGIMLGQSQVKKAVPVSQNDPWAVPEDSKRGSDGKLVVRAGDGKILKK